MKRMLTSLVFIFVIVLWTTMVHATAQQPDILIYNGTRYRLNTNPLEQYFKKYPEKRPKTTVISTGNWRGYVATFEIIDSVLFLKDIEIETDDLKEKSVMNEVFPGKTVVVVDWFNGLLTLPYGQMIKYVHMSYSSIFENYLLLEVRLGNLTKVRGFKYEDYVKFKDKQFELFKQTAEYEKILSTLKKEFKSSDDELLESFLKIHGTEYMTYFIED